MKILKVLLLIFISSQINAQSKIEGKWMLDDNSTTIEIYKKDNAYVGKIVWLEESHDEEGNPYLDEENPDETKRDQPLIGLVMLTDFVQKDNEWTNGKIYDPEEGESYKGKMYLDDKNTLKLVGYWGIFSDTMTWKRKSD